MGTAILENGTKTELLKESHLWISSTIITPNPSQTLIAQGDDLKLIENPLIYFFSEDTEPTTTSIAKSRPTKISLGNIKLEVKSSSVKSSNPQVHEKLEVLSMAPGTSPQKTTEVGSSPQVSSPPVQANTKGSSPPKTSPQNTIGGSSRPINIPPVHAKPEVSPPPISNPPVHAKPEVLSITSETSPHDTTAEPSPPINNLPVHAKPEVSPSDVTSTSDSFSGTFSNLPHLISDVGSLPSSFENISIISSEDIGPLSENSGFQSASEGNPQLPNASKDQSSPTGSDTSNNLSSEDAQSSSENSNETKAPLIVGFTLGVIIFISAITFVGYRFRKKNADNHDERNTYQSDNDEDRVIADKNRDIPVINMGVNQNPIRSKAKNSFPTDSSFVEDSTISYLGLEEVHIISPSSPISVSGSLNNSHLFRRQTDWDGMNKYQDNELVNSPLSSISESNLRVYSCVSSAYSGESLNPFKGGQFTSLNMEDI